MEAPKRRSRAVARRTRNRRNRQIRKELARALTRINPEIHSSASHIESNNIVIDKINVDLINNISNITHSPNNLANLYHSRLSLISSPEPPISLRNSPIHLEFLLLLPLVLLHLKICNLLQDPCLRSQPSSLAIPRTLPPNIRDQTISKKACMTFKKYRLIQKSNLSITASISNLS